MKKLLTKTVTILLALVIAFSSGILINARQVNAIAMVDIQKKLDAKMTQSGYKPGEAPPSSYVSYSTCYGFVDTLCRYLFGHGIPGQGDNHDTIKSSSNLKQIGSTLRISDGNLNESSIKSLFSQAQPGDIVQMNYTKADGKETDSHHTMMVYSVSSTGVTCYHAGSSSVYFGGMWNDNGAQMKWKKFITYLYKENDGISLYRSKSVTSGPAAPTNAWLSCNPTTAVAGQDITFSWGATNATEYFIYMKRNGQDYFSNYLGNSTTMTKSFPEGSYTAYISPWNGITLGSISPILSFKVTAAQTANPTTPWIEASFQECNRAGMNAACKMTYTIHDPSHICTGYKCAAGGVDFNMEEWGDSLSDPWDHTDYFEQVSCANGADGATGTVSFGIRYGKNTVLFTLNTKKGDVSCNQVYTVNDNEGPIIYIPEITNITSKGCDVRIRYYDPSGIADLKKKLGATGTTAVIRVDSGAYRTSDNQKATISNKVYGEDYLSYHLSFTEPGSYMNWLTVYDRYGNSSGYQFIVTTPGAGASTTNLKAAPAGKNAVKLTWAACEDVEGYLIYAKKGAKYGYVGMTTSTSFTDTKAIDTDYNFYWVFSYVKDSTGKMITGLCEEYVYAKGVTKAVTNLKANGTTGKVTLSWTASSGADGYLVYGIRPGGMYGYIGMTTKGTTFTDAKADKSDWTFYWVFPYHKNGDKMIVGGTANYVYSKAR